MLCVIASLIAMVAVVTTRFDDVSLESLHQARNECQAVNPYACLRPSVNFASLH
jgi:hypothetical protein